MKRLGSWLDAGRNLPWYFWLGVIASIAFLAVSIESARYRHVDWAAYQFTVAVFAIAFATLLAALPSPRLSCGSRGSMNLALTTSSSTSTTSHHSVRHRLMCYFSFM